MAARHPSDVEDAEARAARLGITRERVLEELACVAFSRIDAIVVWDAEGTLLPKGIGEVGAAQLAAIAEIVASASTGRIYRIKMHDKKPVLETLARHLGLLPTRSERHEQEAETDDGGDDPRQALLLALDRLAAEEQAAEGDGGAAADNRRPAEG